ncbi:hypothetical protein NADE_001933 [Nannochloris sp. 'desiccata']|nr:hypothetical protein NADE_001933 [Chlorella desiccata (nom. nud.)]
MIAFTPNTALTPKATSQTFVKPPPAFKNSKDGEGGLQTRQPGHPILGTAGVQPMAASTLLLANDVDANERHLRGREDARTYRREEST